jgi:DNA modification methylase
MTHTLIEADARELPLGNASADLVVTSPPYWKKRDYGVEGQMGQEETPDRYVSAILDGLSEWRRVLTSSGSVFLNVGDTYHRRSLAGIPAHIESAAVAAGWHLRNRIIWTKTRGMPDPAQDRLAVRHEYILHLTPGRNYYYDLFGYSAEYGSGANPGDVWQIDPDRALSPHLAPFPVELAARAVTLGCPPRVCTMCEKPSTRVVERSDELDETRSQARRAVALAKEAGLTSEHFAAIRATGISDAGKAMSVQTGTGRNSPAVQKLAAEAKAALGGYFREFTLTKRVSAGWSDCGHGAWRNGIVLDPFSGTGTTGIAAGARGLDYVGTDLDARNHDIARKRFARSR